MRLVHPWAYWMTAILSSDESTKVVVEDTGTSTVTSDMVSSSQAQARGGSSGTISVPGGGTLWSTETAALAVSRDDTGQERRICFRNLTNENLILCWVGTSSPSDLHHFYTLKPWKDKRERQRRRGGRLRSMRRGRETTPTVTITNEDHVETSIEGHAFLIIAADDIKAIQKNKSLTPKVGRPPIAGEVRLIGAYRAEPQEDQNGNSEDDEEDDPTTIHLVEVIDVTSRNLPLGLLQAIRRRLQRKRHALTKKQSAEVEAPNPRDGYTVTARWVVVKNATPMDSTGKKYQATVLGTCRWPVRLEPKWYGTDPTLEELLASDLDAMAACLPPHAVQLLRDDSPTPIWVNKTFQYGPITATGMCFHPGADWLQQQGMHVEKCECVELYSSADYADSRTLWGHGGLLLHEFSHAYHHKGCANGYDNAEIMTCWQAAMDEGLYDSVRVKGTQGPTARAYACTNAMEYFAELSTAFLGGVPRRQRTQPAQTGPSAERDAPNHVRRRRPGVTNKESKNETTVDDNGVEEFNKWYPFNRKQIQEHDPRAYEMLKKIWKVDDVDDK
jgi:hypothetical protein